MIVTGRSITAGDNTLISRIIPIFVTIILLSGCGGGTESTDPAPDPDPDPEPRTTVTVPDVRGLLASDANQQIEDIGLSVGAVTREFNPSTEIDRVTTQNPAGGEMTTLGTAISYEVSRGPRSAPPTTCPAQMIQYFKFEEDGPNYTDELGGASATCIGNGCPMAIPGRVGMGQSFDGSDDGLNVADNDQFDWTLEDEFSIEFWMRSDDVVCARRRIIVGRVAPDVRLNQMWTGTNCDKGESFPRFRLSDSAGTDGGNSDFPTADKGFIDGNWHHVVSVRTLTQIHLYIDGVKRDSIPKADYIRDFITTTELNIGWLNRFQNEFRYQGDLDELAFYKRALADEEILDHFNNGQQGLGYCEVGNGAAQP